MRLSQILLPSAPRSHESNLARRYPIEHASWIWHPDCTPHESVFLRFELPFTSDGSTLRLHLSADQFLALHCDDELLVRAPAAPDGDRWPFHSYDFTPPPGPHILRAEVWRLEGNLAPGQRLSLGGGFILAAEGEWHARLSTGHAPWTVRRLRDAEPLPGVPHFPVWIGCGLRRTLGASAEAALAPAFLPHWWDNPYGIVGLRWKLEPVEIPDPREELFSTFTLAASVDAWLAPEHAFPQNLTPCACPSPLSLVPPHTERSLLIDLGDYLCGWPELVFEGGAGADIECLWAESLLEPCKLDAARHPKGDRAAVAGKHFLGFGDAWLADGARHAVTTHWWRAGRFVLLRVRTAAAPLTLHSFRVRGTGYPWPKPALPEVGTPELREIFRLGWRGFAACTHDLFLDCPFYEQMQYAADTRLMMLVSYVCTGDDRLARRAIALFDRSRVRHGLPSMRAPSRHDMVSTTFALWWIGMVADFARWRRDRAFVAARLEGVRATLDQLDAYRNRDGVLEAVPGWPFVDWGTPWDDPARPEAFAGLPPGARGGVSALVNLHDALARDQAALLEDYAGLPALAAHRRAQAAAIRAACRRFIDPETGLVRDADGHAPLSEHAQIFALLAGLFEPYETARPLAALRSGKLPARASIYFSHHLFEAFALHGCASALLERLGPWREALTRNLATPPEEPEPTRSDCHGWGSHPIYHAVHGLLGLQPEGLEFRRARLRPELGPLPFIEATVPHPEGPLWLRVERTGDRALHLHARIPDTLDLVLADGRSLGGGAHSLPLPP